MTFVTCILQVNGKLNDLIYNKFWCIKMILAPLWVGFEYTVFKSLSSASICLKRTPGNTRVAAGNNVKKLVLSTGKSFCKIRKSLLIGILLSKLFWPTVRKNCPSVRKKTFEKFAKKFEITRTIYSNSERSEKLLVTECFSNLFLEVSQI